MSAAGGAARPGTSGTGAPRGAGGAGAPRGGVAARARAGVDSRVVAWKILRRVNRDGAWTGPAVDRALSRSDLSGRDRAFATNLALSTLRWQGTVDWALGQVVRRPLDQVEPDLLDVLRLGAWQVLYGQVPDRAAVSTAADVGRAVLPARTVGFINGVLRALARRAPDLPWPPDDTVDGRALRLGYPAWVVTAARQRFGAAGADAELDAGNHPPVLTVRAHDLAGTRRALEEAGATVHPATLAAADALRVEGLAPGELAERFGDRVVIQDEASMVVARAVAEAVAAGDAGDAAADGGAGTAAGGTVLDACAAPGGKATHLAQLGLRVVAADRHATRLGLVAGLADRLGVPMTTAVADATRPPWRPAAMAGVLVDAPCSGLGVVRRRPELRWRRDAADPAQLAELQGRLLDASATCVAPGGALVYSVCTWTVAETTDVVEAFLARTPGYALDTAPSGISSAAPGPGVQLGSALHGSDGMYIAVLRRGVS